MKPSVIQTFRCLAALAAVPLASASCGSSSSTPGSADASSGTVSDGGGGAAESGSPAPGLDAAVGADSSSIGLDSALGADSSIPGTDASPGLDAGAGDEGVADATQADAPGGDASATDATMMTDAASGAESGAGKDASPDATAADASPADASSTDAYVGTKTAGTPQAGDITVAPGTTHQIVDGFGQADVWQGSSSSAMQTLLFDPVNGIGLTLLRIGIDGTGGSPNIMGAAAYADGQACVKFAGTDCKVWAAPWSPPAGDKDNNNVNNGGHLQTADYASWANILAAFPAFYKAHGGVDLYAISAQNEPDFVASYQSCIFNSAQMVAWIDVLGPLLAALNPPVKVLAAEPDNWGNLWGGDGYGPAILADSKATSYVGPIATHDYGSTSAGTYARPAPPSDNTHHVWETECTPGDTGAITLATMVYSAFATGGANAWHYWWTEAFVPNVSSPPPQVYALGNFSKFVRPGFYRIDVTGAPAPSGSAPLVVAFKNPPDGTVAIVVVNGGGAQNVSFFVSGTAWPASVTPYVTTATSKLAAGAAVTLTGARFSASLAAQSVTTFVGKP